MSSQVFPTGFLGLKFVSERTPIWRNRAQEAASGKETRIMLMSSPLIRFELAFEVLRDDLAVSDLKRLVGFFNAMNGDFDTFLYTDPKFSAVAAHPFGVGDGVTTAFQLAATYRDATGIGYPEIIQNLNGAPSIFNNAVLQTTPTNYSISSTGVVTFTSAPANGNPLTWTGSFYYRCKFMDGELQGLQEILNNWWELRRLRFRSIRL